MNDIIEMEGSTPLPAIIKREVAFPKYGVYDLEIEIYRNHTWVEAYFSQVKANEFFQIIGHDLEPTKCFVARGNAQLLYQPSNPKNPTLVIPGLEIVTAPVRPTISLTPVEYSDLKLIKS